MVGEQQGDQGGEETGQGHYRPYPTTKDCFSILSCPGTFRPVDQILLRIGQMRTLRLRVCLLLCCRSLRMGTDRMGGLHQNVSSESGERGPACFPLYLQGQNVAWLTARA